MSNDEFQRLVNRQYHESKDGLTILDALAYAFADMDISVDVSIPVEVDEMKLRGFELDYGSVETALEEIAGWFLCKITIDDEHDAVLIERNLHLVSLYSEDLPVLPTLDNDVDWYEEQERRKCKACNGRGLIDDSTSCDECDGTGKNPGYW